MASALLFLSAFLASGVEFVEALTIVLALATARGWRSPRVGAGAAALRAPLARMPENTVKFTVGILLTTFGIFWGAEGTGVSWPGDELALLGVLAFVALSAFALVRILRARRTTVPAEART